MTLPYELRDVALVQSDENSREEMGVGHLLIDATRISWRSDVKELLIEYRLLNMHAICREELDKPSIYCQYQLPGEQDTFSELFLVPQNETDVEEIFRALSTGAELYPDEDEDDSEMITCDTDKLSHWDSLLVDDTIPGQFDDAQS